ncbi:glycoside hydrolase family 78 protein [Paenibacillus mendelii]|uniref:alpha-L-rhamnosidase n=1 Tax=Paenibacillus mendelii TaxID=206163 RepID=A0ABV6JG23_9BACL|nr:glycoside hydrolase family 78 protein [Paenibacillus mendelii]MCQ6557738.1 glycoside hydrolase family 78 protein [Paenibacillus mendelii]
MERLTAGRLRTEYLDDPLGIDVSAPRLGWIAVANHRGAKQTAYRLLVATDQKTLDLDLGNLWDSGKIESEESQHIVYEGTELVSGQCAYWKVQLWDEAGNGGNWSSTAMWSMGLLARDQWQGSWIGLKNDHKPTKEQPKPSIYLRRDFQVRKGVKRATAYATALGLYRLYLNGKRVGNDVFSPEWTDYHVRTQYQTYDVTGLLQEGDNAAGATLGQGWYAGYIGMYGFQKYGMDPSFLLQLNIEYEDGTTDCLVTDEDWKASHGPIVSSDLQMGETVDARLEMPGWNGLSFDDSAWVCVDIMYDYRGWLVSQMSRTIRVTETRQPVEIRPLQDGRVIIDMGQNMAGWIAVTLTGEPGARCTFKFGEVLDDNGQLYTDNLRLARQIDTYVCRGGTAETFEPTFTYHGFRYVEASGAGFAIDDVMGIVVHSDLPVAGELETSHPLVNQLISNIRWTQRANFMSVPTDCPQRDERHGWTGDAQIFAPTAAYNMDVAAFFAKWLVDLEDAQQPTGAFTDFAPFIFGPKTEFDNDFTYTHTASSGWADAPIIVAWSMYETYGDKKILSKHYEAMKKWVGFNWKQFPGGIRKDVPQYGDWLSVNERPFEEVIAEFGRMVSHHSTTPYDIFSTAYMAYNAKLLSDIAGVLGMTADQALYAKRFAMIRQSFIEQFVDEQGSIKGDTQTAYAMALEMDLLPDYLRSAVLEKLVSKIEQAGGMATTGFHGTKFLMSVLTKNGHAELAYRLLLREAYPSWLYSVNQGATTIWERWDGWTKDGGFQDPGMNSFSHFAFGSVGEWLYRNVGGIDRDPSEPGYRKLLIRPRINGRLTSARCTYDSLYGPVKTDWQLIQGEFRLEVIIPANVSALVYIPSVEGSDVLEDDTLAIAARNVELLGREDGCSVYRIASGTYRFVSVYGGTNYKS